MTLTDQLHSQAFSSEQQEYLHGFFAGVQQSWPHVGTRADGLLTAAPQEAPRNEAAPETYFGVALDDLAKEERFKFDQNPLDIWDRLVQHADEDKFPDAAAGDVFRFKFFGLFYVAPAQDSFMLRCRIPACTMQAHQLSGLAEMAEDWGKGHLDITTRGNIQLRELKPRDIVNVLTKLSDLGLTSRGAGADNVRNITATSTSGFDPHELIDVRPYARALHHYILNQRDLYGLPRKFNIAFDSGGVISVCADTNDLAFYAVRGPAQRVPDRLASPAEGPAEASAESRGEIGFRVELGGITGHGDFGRDTGLLIAPEECVAVAAAMLRVYSEHGCRTDRKKARLKYLLEAWGAQKFLDETQKKLSFPLRFVPLADCRPRPPAVKHAHLGVHAQKSSPHAPGEGKVYIGVVMPVGRMSAAQARGIAHIAHQFGSGDLRLSVWQNVLIPDIAQSDIQRVQRCLLDLDLHYDATSVRGGLVACTGNMGCKYAATNTKGHARTLGTQLESRVTLDQPINIHLTGCPHSCAQHYIGDIGLLGAKVQGSSDGEGYHIFLGGGEGQTQGIARQVWSNVPFDEVPALLARVLSTYQSCRQGDESFVIFARRHTVEQLKRLGQDA